MCPVHCSATSIVGRCSSNTLCTKGTTEQAISFGVAVINWNSKTTKWEPCDNMYQYMLQYVSCSHEFSWIMHVLCLCVRMGMCGSHSFWRDFSISNGEFRDSSQVGMLELLGRYTLGAYLFNRATFVFLRDYGRPFRWSKECQIQDVILMRVEAAQIWRCDNAMPEIDWSYKRTKHCMYDVKRHDTGVQLFGVTVFPSLISFAQIFTGKAGQTAHGMWRVCSTRWGEHLVQLERKRNRYNINRSQIGPLMRCNSIGMSRQWSQFATGEMGLTLGYLCFLLVIMYVTNLFTGFVCHTTAGGLARNAMLFVKKAQSPSFKKFSKAWNAQSGDKQNQKRVSTETGWRCLNVYDWSPCSLLHALHRDRLVAGWLNKWQLQRNGLETFTNENWIE